MQYFNPVEDVLDIQLTPYGKQLLSQGKFKPAQYSFSDEGVLYNYETTKRSETQNSANERILNETPYTKVQARNDACITSTNIEADPSISQNNIFDSIKAKINSLGNSDLGDQVAPKTNIYILEGTTSGSSEFLISPTATLTTLGPTEGHELINIPQIEIELLYRSTISDNTGEDEYFIRDFSNSPTNSDDASRFVREGVLGDQQYLDGGYVYVTRQKLFILMEQENIRNSFENFEIEIYDVQDEIDPVTKTNVLRKLRFAKTEEDLLVDNGVMIDQDELVRKMRIIEDNVSFAEDDGLRDPSLPHRTDLVNYYLSVRTDTYSEISDIEVCNSIKILKSNKFGMDIPFECPDVTSTDQTAYDIYYTDNKQNDNC
jgi:hypothetical protein